MYIFLLLAIPVTILCFITANKKFSWKCFIPPVLFGAITAIIVCLIKGLFIFTNHLYTDYLPDTVIYLFLRDSLLPTVLLCALFLLISKDEWKYKTIALFPLTASFHAVFTPFMAITQMHTNIAFLLFVKPVLIVSLCINIGLLASKIYSALSAKQIALVAIFTFELLVQMIAPAIIETLWYFKEASTFYIILSILYVSLSILLIITESKKSSVQNA